MMMMITSPYVYRYGYPDTTYLQRVRDELAAKGITSPRRLDVHAGANNRQKHSPAAAAAAAGNDVKASQRAPAGRRHRTRDNTGRPTSTSDVAANSEHRNGKPASRGSTRRVSLHGNS